VPLHKRKENKPTMPEDLVTVCANWHRMLYRLRGTKSDVNTLRLMVQKSNLTR
jgi:predicted HNH restriction endonuclease